MWPADAQPHPLEGLFNHSRQGTSSTGGLSHFGLCLNHRRFVIKTDLWKLKGSSGDLSGGNAGLGRMCSQSDSYLGKK